MNLLSVGASYGLIVSIGRTRRCLCNNARMHLALFAFDRESAIISALIALIVAGVIVSLGAWVLLRRERRRGR
jgi:hypothetical protein